MIDPSELLRPEPLFAQKPVAQFRDYTVDEDDPLKERVRKTYHEMHTKQTVDFVKGNLELGLQTVTVENAFVFDSDKMAKWLTFSHFKSTVREALEKLNELVDESDPDVDIPNIVHAFQTAEKIRQDYPDSDWFHLTGLVHDLGKVHPRKNTNFPFITHFFVLIFRSWHSTKNHNGLLLAIPSLSVVIGPKISSTETRLSWIT